MKKVVTPLSLDFRLTISPMLDERENKDKTRMTLETTRAFASFVYDLSVKETLNDRQIHWKVNGLKPPRLSIPASGFAKFERTFDALLGNYDVTVEGLDGRETVFKLKFSSNNIQLLETPVNNFVQLVLNPKTISST